MICNWTADYRDFMVDPKFHLFDVAQLSLQTIAVNFDWNAMHTQDITQLAAR
jgi:hypothetical protein